jgi:ribosomal protein L12E/L44/L45/RPP1/RPP2
MGLGTRSMPPETEEREELRSGLKQGIAIQTGVEITCTEKPARPAKRLEVPDMAFSHGSAVVLPSIPPKAPPPPPQRVAFANSGLWQTLEEKLASAVERLKGAFQAPSLGPPREHGLPLIIAALRLLEQNADHELVVAGHADTTGSKAVNVEVSAARARAVVALLEGKRDAWSEAVKKWHADEDVKVVLAWAATAMGWACHPAQNKDVAEAVKEFQRSYNEEFESRRIGVDGKVGPQTRGAWFDVYERFLAERCGGAEQLAALRGNLRWVAEDAKAVACGEEYPLEKPGKDGYRSKLNRRVEVLFFASADLPDLTVQDKPAVLYTGDYAYEVVEPTVTEPGGSAEPPGEPAIEPVEGATDPAPLVTQMPVRRHADPSDPWCFLEPFDSAHPGPGGGSLDGDELLT